MATFRQIKRAITEWLVRRLQPTSAGAVVQAPNVASIHDGVEYGMPVVLTDWMKAQSPEVRKAYLAESARDTFRFQFDTPQRGGNDLPINMPTEDGLREWDWQTRRYILAQCHIANDRNPLCNRGVKYFARFSIGEGVNITYKNKDVERLIEEFLDHPDNCLREYERQAPIDLLQDGELLLRWFGGDTAESFPPVVAPQRPYELEYITTERGFFKRKKFYHFQYEKTEGDSPTGGTITEPEDVPADQMTHVAINKRTYELRGRPEIYGSLPWLRAYKEWLENRARQNHWRGALLWFVQVKSAIANAVSSVASRWAKPPTPGSVAIESENVNVQALTNPVGSSDAGEDGRQIKNMALVGLGAPEYMMSDGFNTNLATASAQQLPALVTYADMQDVLVEQLWYPMFKRVVQMAVDAGLLPEEVEEQDADGEPVREEPDPDEMPMPMPQMQPAPRQLQKDGNLPPQKPAVNGSGTMPQPEIPEMPEGKVKKVKAVDAFTVKYAPIVDAEPFTLSQALQIQANQGWVSNETAMTELGRDPMIELKRIKREQKADQVDRAMGLKPPLPGSQPPVFAGADEDAEDAVPSAAA